MRVVRSIMRKASVATLIGLVLATAQLPGAVDAADGTGSGGASDGVIWAGVQTGAPPSGGSGSGSACTWTLETGYDSGLGEGASGPITMRIGEIEYVLYSRTCGGSSSVVWIPQLDSRQLAQQAKILVLGRLGVPAVHFAPPIDANVVTIGTWIWADRSWWRAVSATAWLPTPDGVVWARTTAVPTTLTFITEDSLREGEPRRNVMCNGPGDEWSWTAGDEITSSCSYTYQHASTSRPGGRFDASVVVEWSISWESNAGSGGSLPSHTTSTPYRLTVQELHALVR
jgi:hypothetical protein